MTCARFAKLLYARRTCWLCGCMFCCGLQHTHDSRRAWCMLSLPVRTTKQQLWNVLQVPWRMLAVGMWWRIKTASFTTCVRKCGLQKNGYVGWHHPFVLALPLLVGS